MEAVVNAGFWRGRRVFLTGHTGFKGGWLSLWLHSLGARVHGYSLPPEAGPSLFCAADVGGRTATTLADVRDAAALSAALRDCEPSIVFHLAAQPLVKRGYADPLETFSTNVMGTANLLEAVRQCPGVEAVVAVTTDKCYENHEWPWAYRESDALGGHDPYSSSKACAELVCASYRRSFPDACAAVATARAGNVIGGGDWAADRLVPDLLRAFDDDRSLAIRSPDAVRPWQHVLEPLAGYLRLAERLAQGRGAAAAWNFGPGDGSDRPVSWVADTLARQYGAGAGWHRDGGGHPHEAGLLRLDSAKARTELGWAPRWDLEAALAATLAWHQAWRRGEDMQDFTLGQIAAYAGV
ncbi:CDP-glucose 4,6-dehydratase [Chromobacterium sp. ATCC 53434]|uniref:CDP-glucose 4,6-dehydratase n=1 Tax=Chromobacterium sp. (strain ATCC 53434 / SC 14030) TaxID=2059672 RepID=UPI000C7767F5|nr:CDP-glucose 4,6-dehydratase [Chromobacterium sp. ATCC 53434]AUH49672.1 CDP-glucose 4,6-dehydratase [Chromobacterium sp. ATCC 53434]